MAKRLFLISGLPGSGKTRLAMLLAQELDGVALATDEYFTSGQGDYVFVASLLPAAHKWNQQRCENRMTGRYDGSVFEPADTIIIHNTFSRRWEKEPYIALAERYGFEVTEIEVKTALSDAQLAARNQHGVSADVIARMRQRWEH